MKKLILSAFMLINLFANDTKIKVYTETYPPFNMEQNGKLTGVSSDILNAMYQEMGLLKEYKKIKIVPWARGYKIVQKKKNTMLFSTTRSKVRENLFKWVGPIYTTKQDILTLSHNDIQINKLNDLNNYKIGAILGWATTDYLLGHGIKKENIEIYVGKDASKKGFNKLNTNQIDCFIYNQNAIQYDKYLLKILPINYKAVYRIEQDKLYYAFNKNTDDKIISKWQKALDKVKSSGKYQTILNKYNLK